MISFPPCKINLGLNVRAKRLDGYHEIETCFYPVPWTDILEIIPSDEVSFASTGLSIPGNSKDNVCLKAYQLLKGDFDLAPVKIHLHKALPTGAGLGGGSSDAAHTLLLLNRFFDLGLTQEQLKVYASKLGSDCSFFIEGNPMLGKGRGEVLTDLSVNLDGKFIVLVNPEIHVSTAEAYAGITLNPNSINVKAVVESDIRNWKSELKNDFESTVFKKYPALAGIKNKLYEHGALYAAMSGSGSTVFGIFESPIDLKKEFAPMIYWSGLL
jgi:4-diphosphocytidyl-2-C-methyl-D-erythritol kinase